MSKLKWFGVKTLYRAKRIGKPGNIDEHFDKSIKLIEERVIVLKAKSFEDAIEKAEKEAREYVKTRDGCNSYKQAIKWEYVGDCDSFWLYKDMHASDEYKEVYSKTHIFKITESKSNIADRLLGVMDEDPNIRKNFVKRETR